MIERRPRARRNRLLAAVSVFWLAASSAAGQEGTPTQYQKTLVKAFCIDAREAGIVGHEAEVYELLSETRADRAAAGARHHRDEEALAAFWAGLEGSQLLWLWLLAILVAVLVWRPPTWDRELRPYAMAILAFTQAFFAFLLIIFTNILGAGVILPPGPEPSLSGPAPPVPRLAPRPPGRSSRVATGQPARRGDLSSTTLRRGCCPSGART